MNSKSLNKNFDSIFDGLSVIKHNVLRFAFAATLLNDNESPLISVTTTMYNIMGTERKWTGVCLFARRDFTYLERVDRSLLNGNVESLFIEITVAYCNVNVAGLIYRPPNGDISQRNDHLYDTLHKVCRAKSYCYILIYFNIGTLSDDASNFFFTLYIRVGFLQS